MRKRLLRLCKHVDPCPGGEPSIMAGTDTRPDPEGAGEEGWGDAEREHQPGAATTPSAFSDRRPAELSVESQSRCQHLGQPVEEDQHAHPHQQPSPNHVDDDRVPAKPVADGAKSL